MNKSLKRVGLKLMQVQKKNHIQVQSRKRSKDLTGVFHTSGQKHSTTMLSEERRKFGEEVKVINKKSKEETENKPEETTLIHKQARTNWNRGSHRQHLKLLSSHFQGHVRLTQTH